MEGLRVIPLGKSDDVLLGEGVGPQRQLFMQRYVLEPHQAAILRRNITEQTNSMTGSPLRASSSRVIAKRKRTKPRSGRDDTRVSSTSPSRRRRSPTSTGLR